MRMKSLPRCATALYIVATAVMVSLARCSGGDDSDAGPDAASDATTDASKDAGKDATSDAAKDSASDAGTDSASDSATDSASDSASDSGSDSASDSGPDSGSDSGIVCGSKSGYGFASVGDGGCGNGEMYKCSADDYQIECDCPTALCTCEKNGAPVGSTTSYAGCPSCTVSPSFSTIAASCGVPY